MVQLLPEYSPSDITLLKLMSIQGSGMTDHNQFQLTFVAAPKPRWSALTVSFVVQAIVVVLLVHYGVIKPRHLLETSRTLTYTALATDAPSAHPVPPQNLLTRAPAPRPDLDHLFEAHLRAPARIPVSTPAPREEFPEFRMPIKPHVELASLPQMPVAKPLPAVQTGSFSSGSSAAPTIKNVTASKVQTGGFGDPNGIKGIGNGEGKLIAAAVGSFDMPGGPGNGNGTGGKRGVHGTVASAGFGNGVATSNPGNMIGGTMARGAIQQAGFGDSRPVEQARIARKPTAPADAQTAPVQILSKPTPAYTAEARALRLEGDVVLEVLFTASGEARVTRVVRGLGHGLDESASRAAAQIKFHPAKREGQLVDSASVIHVMFQLAY
jgi:TonB family protein